MKISPPALFVGTFIILGIVAVIWRMGAAPEAKQAPLVVQVPEFSAKAKRGERAFNDNCAQCHGENATGTEQGPPLIHDIYNPGHHADESFRRAVRFGVRRHHWSFGDMERQEHVKPSEIELIIKYIRELQAANGITYKPHTM